MCGIAGYVGGNVAAWAGQDAAMAAAIAYRGPDAHTRWTDDREVVLHHARLSIIDLEGGGQPMVDATGRFVIVFNGAIYNYLELRAEYERAGARFQTHSDTEVILNGFALKGERVVQELNGMFAFAIWDRVEGRLFIARDQLGKKPLFWTQIGGVFAFASTMFAFRGIPGWSGKLSVPGLVLFSFLGGFPQASTAFAQAHAVPPGHCGWFRPGAARPTLTRYWLPRYDAKASGTERSFLQRYGELLEDAVRLRLRSDVPIALSFSGGTDSGTIAALAAHHAPLRCYTIDYDTPQDPSPEVAIARQVASQLQLPWEHIQFDYRSDLLTGLRTAYRDFDQPCQQLPLVYSRRLHDVMSERCRVVLSGNGADELFTGYTADALLPGFDRRRRWLRRIPDSAWQRLPAKNREALGHVRLDRLSIPEWARRDMRAYARQLSNDDQVLAECGEAIDRLADEYVEAGIDTMADLVMHRGLAVSAADTNFRLPDITGYAAQVEVRSPFLDHRMVEFAASLPHAFKVARVDRVLRPKYLPRRFYETLVGPSVAWAPKLGMGANLHWPEEFVGNAVFKEEMAYAYRQLDSTALNTGMFDSAYQRFVSDVNAGSTDFPTAGTMMNGFMLGEWLGRVYLPSRPAPSTAC